MSNQIKDAEVIKFGSALYGALGTSSSIDQAFTMGRMEKPSADLAPTWRQSS
jgi:hypothetical protein